MKFFIDTANIDEIKEAAALGILDGVTTNPSLVSKEGKDFRKLLDEILKILSKIISSSKFIMLLPHLSGLLTNSIYCLFPLILCQFMVDHIFYLKYIKKYKFIYF